MSDHEISFLGALVISEENSLTDIVKSFCIVVSRTVDNQIFSCKHDVVLAPVDPDNFLAFDNITQEILLAWLDNADPTLLTAMKSDVDQQVQTYLDSIAPLPTTLYYSKQFNF